jgi:hypothetical protein
LKYKQKQQDGNESDIHGSTMRRCRVQRFGGKGSMRSGRAGGIRTHGLHVPNVAL